MMGTRWGSTILYFLFVLVCVAKADIEARTASAISVPQVIEIFVDNGLYGLCASYLNSPLYGKTSTAFKTVTSNAVGTATITEGRTRTVTKTVVITITNVKSVTVTDYFYTETDIYYSFVIKTTTTRTTAVGTTTVYTNKPKRRDESGILAGRDGTFPAALSGFPDIISSACSSLLAMHTKTTTSTKTSTHFVTDTKTVTSTTTTSAPPITDVDSTRSTSTSTVERLSVVTILSVLTATDTDTKVIYTKTTTVSSQCAPTAYVGNAYEYSDSADIHFDLTVPDQADTTACCELCVNRPDCQVWIFYSQQLAYGRCQLVTGATRGVCPAPTFNSGFLPPACTAHTFSGVDIGYGSCQSDIMLTNPTSPDGCALGPN